MKSIENKLRETKENTFLKEKNDAKNNKNVITQPMS